MQNIHRNMGLKNVFVAWEEAAVARGAEICRRHRQRRFNNKKSIKHAAVVKFPELIKSYRSGVSDMSGAEHFTMRSKRNINYCAHHALAACLLMLPLRLCSHFCLFSHPCCFISRENMLISLKDSSLAPFSLLAAAVAVEKRERGKLYHLQLAKTLPVNGGRWF